MKRIVSCEKYTQRHANLCSKTAFRGTPKMKRMLWVIFFGGMIAPIMGQEIQSAVLEKLADNATFAWGAGDWHLRAVLMDTMDNPIGILTADSQLTTDADDWPRAAVTMVSTAGAGFKIRFYRKEGSPINVGDMGIEYVDHDCDGSVVCDDTVASGLALNNSSFSNSGVVVPVELESFMVD